MIGSSAAARPSWVRDATRAGAISREKLRGIRMLDPFETALAAALPEVAI